MRMEPTDTKHEHGTHAAHEPHGHDAMSAHAGHGADSSWGTAISATLHCLTGCAIGEVLGREVTWTPLDAEQQKAGLSAAGVDEGTAGFVVALDAGIAAGELAGDGRGSLSRLIGRPTTPLVEGLRSLV